MPAKQVDFAPGEAGAAVTISDDYFRQICRELGFDTRLELILLIKDGESFASGRTTNPVMIDDLMNRVRSTWDVETQTAQIQYVQLGKLEEPLVLYTRPVGDFLLTLVARSETSISFLSRNADLLGGRLLPAFDMAPNNGRAAEAVDAYAIAWRPVEPMSRAVRQAVKMSARKVAKENGCRLTFIGVATDHVHLVMHCPTHRTSSWVVHVFKSGIQEDLRRQFDVSPDLWRKGFLASPSAEPLAGDELLTYLSGDV
jgi:hypothetical protein